MGPGTTDARRLADEQAAVRRVASLVNDGAPPGELFAVVVSEVVRVLDVPRGWLFRFEPDRSVTVLASLNASGFPVGSRIALDGPSVAAMVLDTGRPARIDDYSPIGGEVASRARESGVRSAFGVPIVVRGALWGLIAVGPTEEHPLPPDTDARLREFTELVAAAISSAESRDRLRGLADLQASLRRVATLVAEGAPIAELFLAVAEEVVAVLNVDAMTLFRFEPDATTTVVASVNAPEFRVGTSWPLDGPSLAAKVFETGRPARIDDYSERGGTIAEGVRGSGLGSSSGMPIIVDGRVWGMSCVGTKGSEPLPAGIEAELHDFSELVAIAISNAESRDRLRRLAVQQASLRRVATRVAEGAEPADLFSAVAEEVARILGVTSVSVVRFEHDEMSLTVASYNNPEFPVGTHRRLDRSGLGATVRRTGRPARIDIGIGVPIMVDGRVWGMVAVRRRQPRETLPSFAGSYTTRVVLASQSSDEIESRLAAFTELIATAVSKAQAHDDLRALAEEHAGLRHVATLVAEAATPDQIFGAVVEEVVCILGMQGVEMVRYEEDATGTVIAASGDHPFPPGSFWTLDSPSIMTSVLRTGRPSRIDDYGALSGSIAEAARGAGFRSAIGAPIVVGGRTWGAIVAFSSGTERIPERSETRLNAFTELVATAVSNATARADLIASRARIVAAGDEASRKLERNLHDGTQQRLIALGLDLQRMRASVPDDQQPMRADLENAERELESVLEDVRELSHGLHPAQLSRRGLGVALSALALKSPIPVEINVDIHERPPTSIETAVYYIVSEAVTNAIKHSRASVISVSVARTPTVVSAIVADDGVGGAARGDGSGLVGLTDRAEALGGRLTLESPRERGTTITVELPVGAAVAP